MAKVKSKYLELTDMMAAVITTPTIPPTGQMKFYFKADGKMYSLDPTGKELPLDSTFRFMTERFTVDNSILLAASVTLVNIPIDNTAVSMSIENAGANCAASDFDINTKVITWAGKELEDILIEGDIIRVDYPVIASTTGGQITSVDDYSDLINQLSSL